MVNDKSIKPLTSTWNWHRSAHGSADRNLRCGHHLFLLLLVPTLSSVFHFCDAVSMTTDTSALLVFKQFADPGGNALRSWNNTQPSTCTSWKGITCNPKLTRVVAVNVSGFQLSGTFAAGTLSNLSMLNNLDVSTNNFQGPMPDDLGNLTRLKQLRALNARFSGSFPHSLANSIILRKMNLAGNNFSGKIPDLSGQTAMVSLDLSSNSFSDTIPALPPIAVNVSLSNNRLNGTIPSSFPTSLKNLDLSNNQLSGSIPSSVVNVNVSLGGNTQLCGSGTPNLCKGPAAVAASSAVPAPAPLPGKHKRKFSTKAIIVIVVVDIVGLGLIAGGLLLYFSNYALFKDILRFKLPSFLAKGAPVKPPSPADPPGTEGTGGMVPENEKSELIFVDEFANKFELEELLRASAEILGKGSLGTTYKARLDNGQMVAVKRLKDVKEMPKKEFEKKMNALGKMNHPNLLPLRAYYYTKEEKLLVYDYMYNGSVASVLHGPKDAESEQTSFPWEIRLQVAYDVALGLNFLHEKCSPQTIPHQNLKSSNVILGNNYEAYLADFCLVPLMPPRIAAQGMTGYAAPEYNHLKKGSEKADIYSYGVLLLELLTGRKPTHASDPDGIDLPKFVKGAVREEWTVEVFDLELKTSNDGDAEMVTVLQIAMRCVEEDPDQRPSLLQVLKALDNMKQAREAYLDRSQSGDFSSTQYDARELQPDIDSASFSR